MLVPVLTNPKKIVCGFVFQSNQKWLKISHSYVGWIYVVNFVKRGQSILIQWEWITKPKVGLTTDEMSNVAQNPWDWKSRFDFYYYYLQRETFIY